MRKIFFFGLILFVISMSLNSFAKDTSKVWVVPVNGVVEPGLSSFIERAVLEVEEAGAECVIFEIDTLGGRVDAAIEIRDAIVNSSISKKIAFVDKRAISAGALIALSADKIYATSMATIGAAKPVNMGAGSSEAKPADEKVVSYLRTEFKATAEKNGHRGDIAEAFVDQDAVIEGIVKEGKLLTLTATEAVDYGLFADKVDNMDSLLEKLGYKDAVVKTIKPNWSEVLVRFLTHPSVSGILMMIGMLGIFTELKTPGLGIPGLVGAACLVLFFFAQHLVGLADHVEMLLFIVGIILLGLEIFVIPGFGVAGVLGLACVAASLFMSLIGSTIPQIPVNPGQISQAFYTMVFVMAGMLVFGFLVFKYIFPSFVKTSPLVLDTSLAEDNVDLGNVSDNALSEGDTGVAVTTLHPTGKASFGNQMIDVFSDGEYVEEGQNVKIVEIAGSRIKVALLAD